MSSAATLDHAELRVLQGTAIVFLSKLVKSFGNVSDPENAQGGILEQYSMQIFSAVKHALSEVENNDSYDTVRLFQAGCETLVRVVEANLANDPASLKRIVRPIIRIASEIPLFSIAEGYPPELLEVDEKHEHCDSRVSSLVRISKLATAAKLFSGLSASFPALGILGVELIPFIDEVAVHCASLAIDGCQIATRREAVSHRQAS